jgi:hypothetical protein
VFIREVRVPAARRDHQSGRCAFHCAACQDGRCL